MSKLSFMSIGLTVAAFCLVVIASAQTPNVPTRWGPAGLVLPIPGGPLSAEQIEERVQRLQDGTSKTEIVSSKVYRDSAGRMRIESDTSGSAGQSFPIVSLIDPVVGSAVILLTPSKIAARMLVPKSAEGHFGFGLPGVGIGAVPSVGDQVETKDLGKRIIEGIEFAGCRITRTDKDQPSLVVVDERWERRELGVTGLAVVSSQDGRHSAKLQNIDRHEPDPELFVIPPGYTVQEMQP